MCHQRHPVGRGAKRRESWRDSPLAGGRWGAAAGMGATGLSEFPAKRPAPGSSPGARRFAMPETPTWVGTAGPRGTRREATVGTTRDRVEKGNAQQVEGRGEPSSSLLPRLEKAIDRSRREGNPAGTAQVSPHPRPLSSSLALAGEGGRGLAGGGGAWHLGFGVALRGLNWGPLLAREHGFSGAVPRRDLAGASRSQAARTDSDGTGPADPGLSPSAAHKEEAESREQGRLPDRRNRGPCFRPNEAAMTRGTRGAREPQDKVPPAPASASELERRWGGRKNVRSLPGAGRGASGGYPPIGYPTIFHRHPGNRPHRTGWAASGPSCLVLRPDRHRRVGIEQPVCHGRGRCWPRAEPAERTGEPRKL